MTIQQFEMSRDCRFTAYIGNEFVTYLGFKN